jgi:SNF2 family DNA or RNA helicase
MTHFEPHPYQQRGIDLLLPVGGAGLFLDPGLGKTAIALMAFAELKEKYPGIQMLVIVPINPMYGTWPAEMAKWNEFLGLTYSIIHGSPAEREARLANHQVDIHFINPEGLKWLFHKKRKKQLPDWYVLCIDESTKFKNSQTVRFKLLKKELARFRWRWIMTGTVAPNGLQDLFGQIYVLDLGDSLGRYITHFRKQYFYQDGYRDYSYSARAGAMEEVTELISPMVLQLKAEDYLKMPDLLKVERKVKLPPAAKAIYKELEKEFIAEVADTSIVAVTSAALGTKLRQVANGAVYDENRDVVFIHDAKLEALDDIREETNGHPLLIMYEFQHDRARIEAHLGEDVKCITGLAGPQLTGILRQFNNGKLKYLLMHPGSAHGINIQEKCHHIVWFGVIWNLEHYIQANTRLYRQGQTSQNVMCYHLVCEATTDVAVSAGLLSKENIQAAIETNLRKYCNDRLAKESSR